MATSAGKLIRSITHLAPGEALGKLCSVGAVVFLGHAYGVVILGVYSLAATISQYLQPIIDFGLKHIGARLVAQRPHLAGEIVRQVQFRRLRMAAAALPIIVIYVLGVRLPPAMKAFLLVFSFCSALYAVSLEWVAWGNDQLHLVGFARAVVPMSILAFLFFGRGDSKQVLWWLIAGNLFGYLTQAAVLWGWWKKRNKGAISAAEDAEERMLIANSVAFRQSSIMGVAWLANLAFNSVDMLMLGLMSNPQQVGLYSAAYRVLNQVLSAYYLLTQSLYPQLSRQSYAERIRMVRPRILLILLGTGCAITAVLAVVRGPLVTLLFGPQFMEAVPLLLLLVWAIPLDFLTSYLSNAYIAWSMEKKVLICTAVAAASNVILNLIWIPHYGARAAAVNTLVSYVIFLVCLAVAGRYLTSLAGQMPSHTMLEPEESPQASGF